jgi:hypothetical protein
LHKTKAENPIRLVAPQVVRVKKIKLMETEVVKLPTGGGPTLA